VIPVSIASSRVGSSPAGVSPSISAASSSRNAGPSTAAVTSRCRARWLRPSSRRCATRCTRRGSWAETRTARPPLTRTALASPRPPISSVSSAGLPAAPQARSSSAWSGGEPNAPVSSAATASSSSGPRVIRAAPSFSRRSKRYSVSCCGVLARARSQAIGRRFSSSGNVREAARVAGLAHCRSSRHTRTGVAAARCSRCARIWLIHHPGASDRSRSGSVAVSLANGSPSAARSAKNGRARPSRSAAPAASENPSPAATPAASRSSRDLPIPGSPSTSTTPPSPR